MAAWTVAAQDGTETFEKEKLDAPGIGGTCSHIGDNSIRVDGTPVPLVPRDEAILRMTDSKGNVWLGQTDAEFRHFGFNWSATVDAFILVGDLVLVSNEPGDAWDSGERLDFEVNYEGDPALACPFTWVE